MDKLQPLIRHHFWICFVLALIFAMTGWWKANAKISEEIEARSKSVADSFANATKGADAPNKSWSDGAQAINASDRKKYESASKLLWERQKAVRVFDPEIREKMAGIKYMDPIPKVATRGEWGILYEKMFMNVLDVVNPFKPAEGTGLVIFDEKRVTHMPFNTWRLRPPTSDEIWKLQEDMWLLRSLLTSLSRVNDGSRRLTESGLREIVQLKLRGGQRDAPLQQIGGAGFAGFSGGGNAPRGADDGDDGSMAAFGGGNAGGGVMPGGVAGQRSGPWTQFELPGTADFMTEEFGPVGGPMAIGGGGGGGGRGNSPDEEDGGFGVSSVPMGAFGTGAGSGMETDRYVDDDPALPYKTRAFFLHVRIRESEIPRMLAELTDSSFPVEIVRLDVASGTSTTSAGAMFTGGNAGGLRGNSDDEDGGGLLGGGMAGINMMAAGGGGNAPQALGNNPGLPANSRLSPDNNPAARAKAAKAAQAAQQTLAAAMMDPSLVTVRVGGLMTLYQTKDEADAQTSNEAAAQQEGGPAAAPQQPAPESGVTPSDSDAAKTPDGAPTAETPATGGDEKVTTDGENAVPEQNQNPLDPATAQPGDPAAGTGAEGDKQGTADESALPATSPDAEKSSDSDSESAPEGASETNGASGDPASSETSSETKPAEGTSGSESSENDAAADGSGSSDTGESGEVTDEKK